MRKLETKNIPSWCPGCGNFAIWSAFKQAAVKKGWDNTNTVFTAGIGCHGHMVNFVEITSFEGLHGRPIPVASGIKMANHKLNVFAFTGDGDCLAEGGNHLIHSCRRNDDITVILHDNAIYGLTVGQTSPRSSVGYRSKSTPKGNIAKPINPLQLAIISGATFVARGYAGNIDQLSELMIMAQEHKGFSLIDVLQPCVTFNREYGHYYYQRLTYQLDGAHDKTNKMKALEKAEEWGDKIPVGILYEVQSEAHHERIPQIKNSSLVGIPLKKRNIEELFKNLQ
jgi:2-oxoglutarate/2-oxoacid ferredoxin oxidoreductase subunit beta